MLVGKVKEIWRFPVKSLGGECLAASEIHKIGMAGVVVALLAIVASVLLDSDENSDTSGTVEQTTTGNNSPAISNVKGDVSISTGSESN